MMCKFVKSRGKLCVCPTCGNWLRSYTPERCFANCKGQGGLGDRLAVWLAVRFGITERRYRDLKVRWGFSDACNCRQRRRGINWVGRKVKAIRERLAAIIR
jgi:predicted NACHT family NTPase